MGVWDSITGGLGSVGSDIWDSMSDPGGHLQKRVNQWSGADDTASAAAQQQQYINQGMGVLQDYAGRAQGLMNPYIQAGNQNFSDFQGMLRGGQFSPQFQGYQGPMSAGGQNSPQLQSYQGAMTSGNAAPQYQAYQGPMTSGNQLPQYQQFQGPTQYQAQARPDRQMATMGNIQSYVNPFLDKIIAQGTNAISHSGAGRGLFGSTGNINDIGTFATNAASNAYNDAAGRFMQDQNSLQNDYTGDRNFGMQNFNQNFQNAYGINRDMNNWGAANADRAQNWFEGDRAAGLQNNQFANNYAMNQANFNQNAFEGDRAAGMANNAANNANAMNLANFRQNAFEGDRAAGLQNNQFQNNWNMNNAQNNYQMWNGLANMGYTAAQNGANLYNNAGQNMSDLLVGQGNAAAAAGMNIGNQRRGLIGSGFGLFGGLMGGA